MQNPLTRKKTLASSLGQVGDSDHSLKRTLGARHLVALGIGAIIGAGSCSHTPRPRRKRRNRR